MQEIALFSRKIYTPETNFTRLPFVTVATNLNSDPWQPELDSSYHCLADLVVLHGRLRRWSAVLRQ